MSANHRVKHIRKALGLSQAKFAVGISVSNGYVAGIELGNRNVNDRIVKLICSAYNVNEGWLKTGEGEMFRCPPDDKLARVVSIFTKLSPEFQDYVLHQIDKLLEIQSGGGR
jgi:transcriptional regulator with XRE-family HTH domain